MSSSPSSARSRAVIISGVGIHLAEQPEYPLVVELSINGINSCLVTFEPEPEEELIGDHLLQEPLNLPEGSVLSVKVKEQYKSRDITLAELNLSLDHIWPAQELNMPDNHVKKYQISLPDANQQIWLNVSMLPSSIPTSSNNSDQTLQADAVEKISVNRRTEQALKEATHSLQNLKTVFEPLGGADPRRTTVGQVLGELHSTAKIVIEFVKVVCEEIWIEDQRHKVMLDLAESMETALKPIPGTQGVVGLNALKSTTIESFYQLMNKTFNVIQKQLVNVPISNIVQVFESQRQIESLKKEYNLFEKVLNVEIGVDLTFKTQELRDLDGQLGGIKQVNPRANPCIHGTRINILSNVESKIDDLEGKNVVWIHGAPGSGKSALSLTLKTRLHQRGLLLTYFMFDRNDWVFTTSRALWCHVAYDLAKRYPSMLKHNLSLLRGDKVNLTSTTDLFKSLIEEPLSKLTDAQIAHPLVVIIDALDECGGLEGRSSSDRKALLKTLERWPKLSSHFKLLVTSRDENDITRVLAPIGARIDIPSGHFLTENPQAPLSVDASRDLHIFFESRFQSIREDFSLSRTDWPGTKTMNDMVRCAAGVFIWATTATDFIHSCPDPRGRLGHVMGNTAKSGGVKPLYSLYTAILEMSFGNISSNDSETDVLKSVLGTMVLAKRLFQDIEYTKLPTTEPVTEEMLCMIRDGLSSVVAPGPRLRFVHKSFDDFLLSEDCPPKFAIEKDKTERLLTELCLMTMTAELHFNICGLKTSWLKNKDVPDIGSKVMGGISSLLSYSCWFWADHLSHTSFDEQLMGMVKEMILDKLLYWFEAMSLLEGVNRVSHSLLLALNWSTPSSDEGFKNILRDARRFIDTFSYPIAQSAPHIYISALPFAPEHSFIVERFLPQFPGVLSVSKGRLVDWSPCVFTSENHEGAVHSVAFSPDEKHFASGSNDGTVCICDSDTRNLFSGPFRSSDGVRSCFFDPSGQRVWAHYRDGQGICWDIETGGKHAEFQAREGDRDVFEHATVSFSPDGSYMAWAGRNDTTPRIRRLEDGSEIRCQPCSQSRFSHTKPISTLSFSVDDFSVVSGSADGTILIWNAETGTVINRPLPIGKHRVDAVAYSHTKGVLVSASGDPGTVIVWNASTHKAILGPLEGHTSKIMAIALSHSCRWALSASNDGTVRMWDLMKKGAMQVTHTIRGAIRCVAFSPCGNKLASLDDDKTIRVWNASTGEPLLHPINTVSSYTRTIFSPDGSQLVAFCSTDGTIRAWSASTGEPTFSHILRDDNYDETWIEHMTFRTTDQRLVTCSNHGVIQLWSLEDGSLIEDLSASSPQAEDPGWHVEVVALSPDGLTAIVCDDNRTPHHYIWNTTTSQPLSLAFTDDVYVSGELVAYSPSGRFFAATKEVTLRVWDTQTGELAANPSKLDGTMLGCLAFSPDDCHIALSYDSSYFNPWHGLIWIWNAHTRRMVSPPWMGHSSCIMALAFSPDGEKLASGSESGQIGIWNPADQSGFGPLMYDGWVTDASGNEVFWVPKDYRSGLVLPQHVAVMDDRGMRTELDLTKFKYGENWTECFDRRK